MSDLRAVAHGGDVAEAGPAAAAAVVEDARGLDVLAVVAPAVAQAERARGGRVGGLGRAGRAVGEEHVFAAVEGRAWNGCARE